MFLARKAAPRVLPLLVVIWAVFVIFGGAMRLVEKAEPSEGSTVQTVAGFCTAFVALAAGAYVVRASRGLGFFLRRTLRRISYPCCVFVPEAYCRPYPPGPPVLQLLQVLRT